MIQFAKRPAAMLVSKSQNMEYPSLPGNTGYPQIAKRHS
jgi:hypothetical protein